MSFQQLIIDSGAPQSIKIDTPISPTLVIGLGGTGKEVLLRLRRLIVERFGSLKELPCIEFLHIDTDQKQTAKEQYDLKADDDALYKKVMFQPTETIPLTIEGGTKRYIMHIDKYPYIKRWFQHKGKIGALGDLGEGAGQIRMASRLAFFHDPNFTKICDTLNRVHSKLKDTSIREKVQKHKLSFEPKGMEVYVITSIGGGTGSGIFLEVGFLVKEIFQDAERVGMVFMPKLFEKYPGYPRIYANGYAALMELNKYSFGNKFMANWDGRNLKEILPPPFSYTYFLDSSNESGFNENNEKSIYQMAAESIFQDYSIGGFAAMKRSTRVNLVQYTMNVYLHDYWDTGGPQSMGKAKVIQVKGDTYPTRFSALGLSVISFPADKVHSACAFRFARNVLEFWQNELLEDPLEKLVTSFLTHTDISFFQGEYERKDGGGLISKMDIEDEMLFYNKDSGQTFANYLWDRCQNARNEIEAAPKGRLSAVFQDHRNRFDQLMAKEDSDNPKEWGEDVRLLESNMRRYIKQLKEGIKKESDRIANSSGNGGVAHALSLLIALKDLLPKGSEKDSFKYMQYFEENIPAWQQATTDYLGSLDQYQLELDKHDRSFLFRGEDVKRDIAFIFGTRNEPGAFYNYMFARVMKQVVKRGKLICREIDDFLGKDSDTGKGLISEYRRLVGCFSKMTRLFTHKEDYFSRDFYTEKSYTFWKSLYREGDMVRWYERWVGKGEVEIQHLRDWGNSLLKKVFQADCVTDALNILEKTPEEEIETKVLMHFKDYFVNHPDQPSALEILMDSNNYTKDKQVQIIKNAYEIAKVWVKGGGVDHINFHAPGSGQKPSYIGIDGNDIVKRKEFLDIVENIKGPGEITQPLDIGESNKSHIVFYNELAGITAFYPHSISAQGGMKQRYNEFYTNSKLFDPENQEELHTDKNRFQFNDLIPKTDEETFRYKAAIRAFVLSRLLGMMRVEDNEFGGDTFEQIYCYEYRDPFDNNVKEFPLGNEFNAIDMLYRDTSKNDSWRVQILDNVEEVIRVIIQKKMLAQYLLLIEFYLREVYPYQSDQLKERGDMVITRYSPQYAILEFERRRIYEKVLVDPQSKKQVITALNSLRGKTDDKGMRYNDYADALKPFTKESGKFERVEETMVGEFKSVYYEAFALDFSKLGLLKEKIVEPQMKKTRLIDEEPNVEEEKAMGPESMNRPCPVCKTDINVRAIYCYHCQNTVGQHLTCTRCGEDKVPSDLKTCWKCGNLMVREEKLDCPRCYSFKGYKREFPCKVCGFTFEAENSGTKKTSTDGDSSRPDRDDKKNTGQTGTAGTKENFSEEKKNSADAGTEKEETFQSSDQKSQAGESASASPGDASSSDINDEVVECQNCFSQVKKGPRCPVCQAPLNLSY